MKVLRLISEALLFVAAFICLPAILGVLTVDIVLRFAFKASLRWSTEFASLMLFLSFVFALPSSWLRGEHIRADFLLAAMRPVFREAVHRISWALLAVLSGALIWQSWRDIQFMLRINDATAELNVPVAYMRGCLVVAALVLLLIALLKMVTRRKLSDEENGEVLS